MLKNRSQYKQDNPEDLVELIPGVYFGRDYGLLVETCREFGIGRGKALRLAREKKLSVSIVDREPIVLVASVKAFAESMKEKAKR